MILETDNGSSSLNAGSANNVVSKGVWHHLAFVRDNANCAFYVDGNNVGYYDSGWKNVLSDFGITTTLRIGANKDGGSANCWVGEGTELVGESTSTRGKRSR